MAPVYTQTARVSGDANLEIMEQINSIIADTEYATAIEKSTSHAFGSKLSHIPTILQSQTIQARASLSVDLTNSTSTNFKQPLPYNFTMPRAIAAIIAMFTLLSLFLLLSMLFCCGGYKFFVREAEFWWFKRQRAQFEARVVEEELEEVLKRQKKDEEVLLRWDRLGYSGYLGKGRRMGTGWEL